MGEGGALRLCSSCADELGTMADAFDDLTAGDVATAPTPSASAAQLSADALHEHDGAQEPGPIEGIPAGFRGPPGWDPALHVYPPRRTARRTWALLTAAERERRAAQLEEAELADVDFDAIARNDVDTFGALVQLMGPDWAPSDQERAHVAGELARVYRKRGGGVDLPPEFGLAIAVGAYALPRVAATPAGDRALTALRRQLVGAPAEVPDGWGDADAQERAA